MAIDLVDAQLEFYLEYLWLQYHANGEPEPMVMEDFLLKAQKKAFDSYVRVPAAILSP